MGYRPLSRVAGCPKLAWRGARLQKPEPGIQALADLANNRSLARLLQLDLFQNDLGDDGVHRFVTTVLTGNALLQLMAWLGLRMNSIGDAGGVSLADAINEANNSLGKLVTLDLSMNHISDAGLANLRVALATVPAMRTLYYSNGNGRVRSRFNAACHE